MGKHIEQTLSDTVASFNLEEFKYDSEDKFAREFLIFVDIMINSWAYATISKEDKASFALLRDMASEHPKALSSLIIMRLSGEDFMSIGELPDEYEVIMDNINKTPSITLIVEMFNTLDYTKKATVVKGVIKFR